MMKGEEREREREREREKLCKRERESDARRADTDYKLQTKATIKKK